MLIANYILSLIADLLFISNFFSFWRDSKSSMYSSAYRKDTFISVAIKTWNNIKKQTKAKGV